MGDQFHTDAEVKGEAGRLLQLRRGVLVMLRNQDFCVQQEELDMSLAQFTARFGSRPSKEDLNIVTDESFYTKFRIYVFFMEEEVVKKDTIVACLDKMDKEHVDHGMFVVPDDLSFFAEMAVMDKPRKIAIFRESRILMLAELLDRLQNAEPGVDKSEMLRHVRQQQLRLRYFSRDSRTGTDVDEAAAFQTSSIATNHCNSIAETFKLSNWIQSRRALSSRNLGRIIQDSAA